MAKESMKAREIKRAKLCAKYAEKRKKQVTGKVWLNCPEMPAPYANIIAAPSQADQRVICVSSAFRVFSFVKWQVTV